MLAQTGAFSLGQGLLGPGLESPRSSRAGRGSSSVTSGDGAGEPVWDADAARLSCPPRGPSTAATLAAGVSRLSPAPERAERAVVSARLPLLSLLGAGSRRKAGVWGKARTFLALDAA